MKVLIIEDEILAAEKLEQMLHNISPDIEVLAKLGSIKESVGWLIQHTADLIFLDIQLSDGISFSIFNQITVSTPIVFTTAYDQYAVKAFQLNSIAYLLKPIRTSDLAESIQKYKTLKSAFNINFDDLFSQLHSPKQEYKKRLLIHIGDKIRKIDVPDIAYFYIFDKYVFLKTFQGNTFPIDYTLDKLEEILDPAYFFRINRKYTININAIANMYVYSRGRIKLDLQPKVEEPFDLVVSTNRSGDFKRWLNS